MDIYFLRHGSAGEAKLTPAKDEQRTLDKLGIEQSHNVGHTLAALGAKVDAMVSSPLARARQTAALVADEVGHDDEVIIDAALRPEATYEQFQDLLRRYSSKEAILLVGHNPSMTEFLNRLLAGGVAPNVIELKKGSIAKVEKAGREPAVLKWYLPPKIVRAIQ